MSVRDDPRKRKKSATEGAIRSLSHATADIPVLDAGASTLIEAAESQEIISIPGNRMSGKNICVVQVKGDCMLGDHLLDGDYLTVQIPGEPMAGEMVVASVKDHGVIVRRFQRDGDRVRLEPVSPSGEAIIFDAKDVTIKGVVIGILRKYTG